MIIHSIQLGDIEVDEKEFIDFPHGLPGFPDEKSFVLLPYQAESPFGYLQSTTQPKLTFLVVDPFIFFKDYEFQLQDDMIQELELVTPEMAQILNIVSVPGKAEDITTNLLAPIVRNTQSNKAIQIILEKTSYTTRHRLFAKGATQPLQTGGE